MKQTDYKTRVKLFSLDLCGDLTEVRRVTNTINNKSQNSLHRLPWNQYCWCPPPPSNCSACPCVAGRASTWCINIGFGQNNKCSFNQRQAKCFHAVFLIFIYIMSWCQMDNNEYAHVSRIILQRSNSTTLTSGQSKTCWKDANNFYMFPMISRYVATGGQLPLQTHVFVPRVETCVIRYVYTYYPRCISRSNHIIYITLN